MFTLCHFFRNVFIYSLIILWPLFVSSLTGAQTKSPSSTIETEDFLFRGVLCGDEGHACCGPSPANRSELDPPFCNKTLGCNILTNRCESPCGQVGQVCCDGPDTDAPRKGLSPNSRLLKPMCEASVCDGTKRRCVTDCGMKAGEPCCGPQPPLAVASCINPSLTCHFDDVSSKSGLCRPCGGNGQEPCPGEHCQPKLVVAGGHCVPCGAKGLPSCNDGCDPPLVEDLKSGLCVPCGTYGVRSCENGCQPPLVPKGFEKLCYYVPQPTPPAPLGAVGGGSGSGKGSPSNPPSGNTGKSNSPLCANIDSVCVDSHQSGIHCCGENVICNYGYCKACVPHGAECLPHQTQICCDAKNGDICTLDQSATQQSGRDVVTCGIPDQDPPP